VLLYWSFRLAALLARRAPLPVAYGVARLAGAAAYYAWPAGRRRCIDNMRHVVGGDERLARRYARRSFANYAVYLVDFLRLTYTTPEEVRSRVAFEGWEDLHSRRTGNGIVLVTLHLGNWDLGGAGMALQGFPVTVIADTFGNRRLNEMVLGARAHFGLKIVPAERMGPELLRSLRRNGVIALMADIPAPGRGIEVEFFGATIAVNDGPARIALRAGSAVVAATVPRLGAWTDRVAAHVAPVHYEPTGETEHDVRALTQALFAHLEQLVRRHPDQWYIFRHLWVADAGRTTA
jgi:lauroyl/myristoyl acyltransferase